MRFAWLTLVLAALCSAQRWRGNDEATIRAQIRGGSPDRGKCTAEVEVDGVAEVGISLDTGRIRTISGQPASWRRLECSGPLPASLSDFKFKGIDGRGRQELIQDPRSNRGLAVIRIEDSKGGREGYTFDIEWRAGGNWQGGGGGWNRPGSGGSGWGNNNQGGWGSGGSGWGNNNQGGWGSGGSGWGNNNQDGWGSGWGNTFSYRGTGNGLFTQDSGQRINLRGAFVTIDRRTGDIQIHFDSPLGAGILQFTGRLQRISGGAIQATLINGVNRGDSASVQGSARILLTGGNRVRSIAIDGRANLGRFTVNYSE